MNLFDGALFDAAIFDAGAVTTLTGADMDRPKKKRKKPDVDPDEDLFLAMLNPEDMT